MDENNVLDTAERIAGDTVLAGARRAIADCQAALGAADGHRRAMEHAIAHHREALAAAHAALAEGERWTALLGTDPPLPSPDG